MKNILKRFGFLVTLIGVVLGVAGFAPANAAAGDSGFTFTVTSTSHGVPTASTTLSNTQEGLVNGATQMLWEDSNFNGHLTPANVKQAFKKRIKVIATGANSSQVIYKRSHHRKEVVLVPNSKVRNTGLHNHIRGGFVWTTGLEVLRYDAASHQYRHAASLLTNAQLAQARQQNPHKVFKVVGRVKLGHRVYNIVVWCGNFIGGNVSVFPYVVQVASPEDLVLESDAASVAKALVTVDFNVQCPNNGPSFGATGYAYAYASASSHIRYTQPTKPGAVSAIEEKAKQQISIDQTVTADAQASITVSGSCGSSTPPTATVTIDKGNDLDQTDPNCLTQYDVPTTARQMCASWTIDNGQVIVPDGVTGTMSVNSDYGTAMFSNGTPADFSDDYKSKTVGSGTYNPEIRLDAPSELPPTPCSYDSSKRCLKLTLTFTPQGGSSVSDTTEYAVNPTPTPLP